MPTQRWTGLKGKPESADMKFVMKQNCHRFPLPGYNTWHDRVLKEQRGHERLMRVKINDMFAAEEDETIARGAEEAGSSSSSINGNTARQQQTTSSGGYRSYNNNRPSTAQRLTGNQHVTATPGLDYAAATQPNPQSASNLNAKPMLFLPQVSASSSGMAGGVSSSQQQQQQHRRASSGTPSTRREDMHSGGPLNRSTACPSDGNSASSSSLLAPPKPVPIEFDKMQNLSDLNVKRLENIWPQIGRGWNSRDVQQTLYWQGRDTEESPLRTVRGCECPSSQQSSVNRHQQQHSPRSSSSSANFRPHSAAATAGTTAASSPNCSGPRRFANNNNGTTTNTAGAIAAAGGGKTWCECEHPTPQQQFRPAPPSTPPTPTIHNQMSQQEHLMYNSVKRDQQQQPTQRRLPDPVADSYAYNRRIRAPAVPEPFLGKRGTSRQNEAEATTKLLRKLTDLEEEIASQQRCRDDMTHHVQELKSILLQDTPDGGGRDSVQRRSLGGQPADDRGGSVASIQDQRALHFNSGAHEKRNVHFSL